MMASIPAVGDKAAMPQQERMLLEIGENSAGVMTFWKKNLSAFMKMHFSSEFVALLKDPDHPKPQWLWLYVRYLVGLLYAVGPNVIT